MLNKCVADLTEWHLKMIHGFTYMQPQEQRVFFNLFNLENYVVTYLKFPDLFIIRIHIVAPTRTTTKSPSAISKPVANVKATVNSGGGDNGAKIAELTQQVWMQSKAICVDT